MSPLGFTAHKTNLPRNKITGHQKGLLGKFKRAIRRKTKLAHIWDPWTGKLDKMGVIMMIAMINLCTILPVFWLSAYTVQVFIFPVGFLPWQIVTEELIDRFELGTGFLVSGLRYVSPMLFSGTMIIENFRTLGLILLFLVMPIQLYLHCIKLLEDFQIRKNALGSSYKFRQLFIAYNQMQVLIQESHAYTGIQISFLLFSGAIVSVIANFGTVRAHLSFPLSIYFVIPTLSILVLLIIQLLLPFAINVHEHSEAMLTQWKSDPIRAKGKYLRRKLKSLRSLRWYAGVTGFYECNFFILENSFKMAYYSVILDYTISMIMLVPASEVAGFKFTV
jgi:hypothetical protein